MTVLGEGGAHGRDEAEVDHDEEFAESEVSVGLGATGVEPPRGHGTHSQGDEDPRRANAQGQSRQGGHGEEEERRALDRALRNQPRSRQAKRSDASLVGSAHAVGVVIGVVGPDLQGEGDNETEERVGHVVGPRAREGRTDHYGHRGGRQRASARGEDPAFDRSRNAHGRLGKREKSGLRCSTKALRPSWPSSDI